MTYVLWVGGISKPSVLETSQAAIFGYLEPIERSLWRLADRDWRRLVLVSEGYGRCRLS